MKKKLILAGRKQEFDDWIWSESIDRTTVHYANDPEQFRGMEFSDVQTIGTFWSLNCADEIFEEAWARIR